MKSSNKYLKEVQWLIIIVAYAYLIYKLITFDNYHDLLNQFTHSTYLQVCALIFSLILFPLNIFAEAIKWKYLLKDIEPMTYRESLRQTFFGQVGAFLTPARLGDYPARVTMLNNKDNWLSAITLGFIGTLALSFTQVALGLPSTILIFSNITSSLSVKYFLIIVSVVVILFQFILIIFYPRISNYFLKFNFLSPTVRSTLSTLKDFSHKDFFVCILLSLIRYLIYCFQLYLVLYFCSIDLSVSNLILAIPAYYFLVTVTPSIPIADAAIRGSWSMIIFSLFTDNVAAVAIAAILLWVLNSILPMVVGTLIKKD